jgi:hypothetical protein
MNSNTWLSNTEQAPIHIGTTRCAGSLKLPEVSTGAAPGDPGIIMLRTIEFCLPPVKVVGRKLEVAVYVC